MNGRWNKTPPVLVRKDSNVQAVKTGQETFYGLGDCFTSADGLAFDVKGHIGVVEGHAQEGPAAVEYEADTFIRRFGNGNPGLSGPFFKGFEDVGPVGLRVVALYLEAVFDFLALAAAMRSLTAK